MLDFPARPGGPAKTSKPAAPVTGAGSPETRRAKAIGLTATVLALTISFVLLAMGLFYVFRLSAFRETWLHNKMLTAQAAVDAFVPEPGVRLPDELAAKILAMVGAKSIVVSGGQGVREIRAAARGPALAGTLRLGDETAFDSISEAFHALFAPHGTIITVADTLPPRGDAVQATLDETPLVEAMWRVSNTFLTISLMVAAVVTCVLWAALWQLVLRPVRRLTSNIIAFGENPQDVTRVIAPSGRADEIGRAETALAAMQNSLAHELAQRKRLAELGMAVARINHDLRNILTAAQLISDRLAAIPDPLAQRLAPRLVATLDRAIQFCQATLTYGAAREQAPNRNAFDLSELVRQVVDSARAENGETIDYHIEIPPMFDVYADRDHVLRVLENLSRNATQALIARGAQGERPKAIRFAAIRAEGFALIEISDTGPGFPPDQSERIFEPFHMSTSEAGTGLGLAIAADLVARNGGAIALAPSKPEDFYCGARFLIKLPTLERGSRSISRLSLDA